MMKPKVYKAKRTIIQQSEKDLQKMVCEYLRIAYPKVLFNSDMAGAMKLTIGQATQISKLRSNRGFPDIAIYEPRNEYSGLFIELKKEGESLVKRDGSPISEHVQEQVNCINLLNAKGYYCRFCCGFDSAKETIDEYLKQQLDEQKKRTVVA